MGCYACGEGKKVWLSLKKCDEFSFGNNRGRLWTGKEYSVLMPYKPIFLV